MAHLGAMQRYAPHYVALAVALAALAGFVDALAFTTLGGFFASFMSGNTTRLGVGLGTGVFADAVTAAALVLSFVTGVMVSSIIARAVPGRAQPVVMAAVTLLLLAAAIFGALYPSAIVLTLLAMAMGAENGVFSEDGEVTIGLTYMTGSLVRMGQRLAGALMGDADRWSWLRYLALWLGFLLGVVLGAAAQGALGWGALWIAPVAAAVMTGVVGMIGRTAPRRTGDAPATVPARE